MNDILFRNYSLIGDGQSADIYAAIMSNDCKFVIDYYNNDNDMDIVDERKENLLHKASKNNHFEVFDLLVRLGVSLSEENTFQETPLHLACLYTNADIVERIIFEGFNVNVYNKNKVSPLHIAASRGSQEIIHSLINAGAKINASDENSAKPIHYATISGKKEVVRLLLNYGASLMEVDDRMNNVLHYATMRGNNELSLYLLRHTVVSNSLNIFNETPLHHAAVNCNAQVVEQLLIRGYDPLMVNKSNKTPVDLAKEHNKFENYAYLRKFINLDHYRIQFLNYELHQAILHRNTSYVLVNLTKENANSTDYFNRSLLYHAINTNQVTVVRKLLTLGAKLSNVDEFDHPALLIAIYNDNAEIVKMLLKKQADPNFIIYDRTYLYRAILKNNLKIAKLLVEYGADTEYIDSRNRSTYSYALEYGSDEIIELFNKQEIELALF